MRSLFILAFVLMQFGAMAADVPSIVTKNFQAKYPTATDVEWYDEEDGSFAAYFYINEQSKTAKFNKAGNWTETKTFMDMNDMPKPVINAMNSKYKGADISSVTMIEVPSDLNQYEVSAEMNNTTYLLTYDEKGTLLKTLEEVNNTDADDAEMEDTSEDDDE